MSEQSSAIGPHNTAPGASETSAQAQADASTGRPESGPKLPQIPELKDVLVGELAVRGNWVVANVQTSSFWPVNAQKVSYRGETIWIFPITHKHFPAVAMQSRPGRDGADCERLLMRFLSNLAWVEEKGLLVEGIGGGSLPVPMGRDKSFGFSICDEFDLSYFPEPTDEKALLALALMREGRGLNHPGYAFLSFYRVLEVAFPEGRARGEWINSRMNSLPDHRAKEALAKLHAQGIPDIGIHLRDSGRRAMAHAREAPIIDPDDPADARRLRSELPIMIALAKLAIEEVFCVETSDAVYRKHLYELAAFKKIVGPEIVDHLKRGEQITDGSFIDIPRINVQLRRHAPYSALSNLQPVELRQRGTSLFMRFESEDGNVQVQFRLDFAAERLEFDLFTDLGVRDSGTADGAIVVAEVKRFSNAYFGNGELHIYDAESGVLLSRKDAFIPMNMWLDHDAAEVEVARWMQLADERRNTG
jgi:hypothetical protein